MVGRASMMKLACVLKRKNAFPSSSFLFCKLTSHIDFVSPLSEEKAETVNQGHNWKKF